MRVILILSHMRSGSSLLTNILNTNEEIYGFGESRIRYSTRNDLVKLVQKVNDFFGKSINPKSYYLDKLLHDKMIVNSSILKSSRIYCIFLVRTPAETIESMLKLYSGLEWEMSLTDAICYYKTRLKSLIDYSHNTFSKKNSVLITYDQLINSTDMVLYFLQQWLEIKTPLSEFYNVHKATGMVGIGDTSDMIKEGRIVRVKRIVADSKGKTGDLDQYYAEVLGSLFTSCSRVVGYF